MSTSMRLASFNVNGIRARMPVLEAWLERERPDVVCLQETKVQDQEFPQKPLNDLGYECAIKGQKSFNGVAVLSKTPVEVVRVGLDDDPPDEARLILVRVRGVSILNTYVPQGTAPDSDQFQYKLQWFGRLRSLMDKEFQTGELIVWVGDFNVAPDERDVHDPKGLRGEIGFHPEEHRALEGVREWGWVDVFRRHVKEAGHYTFWDYRIPNAFPRRLGWRVDHIWATEPMAERSTRAWIDVAPRKAERPSDHTPILAEFMLD